MRHVSSNLLDYHTKESGLANNQSKKVTDPENLREKSSSSTQLNPVLLGKNQAFYKPIYNYYKRLSEIWICLRNISTLIEMYYFLSS